MLIFVGVCFSHNGLGYRVFPQGGQMGVRGVKKNLTPHFNFLTPHEKKIWPPIWKKVGGQGGQVEKIEKNIWKKWKKYCEKNGKKLLFFSVRYIETTVNLTSFQSVKCIITVHIWQCEFCWNQKKAAFVIKYFLSHKICSAFLFILCGF